MSLLEELKRRKVIRVGIAYVIGAGKYQRVLEALGDVRETERGSFVHAICAGSACMGLRQADMRYES